MSRIRLHTFGTLDLTTDGAPVAGVLTQPKRLALLAHLAASRPRGFQSRDSLVALFWPEADSERARNSLRQALHQLRKALGDDAIATRGDREVAIDETVVWCDAAAFDDAVDREDWIEAVALYRGDFLPGLHVQDAGEAERWIDTERSRLRRRAVDASWNLVEQLERSGDLTGAARAARRAAAIDPTDEGGARRTMELLARVGDTAGALSLYEELMARLGAEFGMRPSRETTALANTLGTRAAATTAEMEAVKRRVDAPTAQVESGARRETRESAVPEPPTEAPRPASAATTASDRRRTRGGLAMTAVALMALVAGAFWVARDRRGAGTAPGTTAGVDSLPSIAVLPFENMSGDPSNDFFSDGMTEELLHLLAQLPDLQVAARTSAFALKGSRLPADSIGRLLRVRHLLEGSIRRAGDRMRVTAQLIDTRSGYHLWSGTFDTRVADVVQVQDSIGRVIVERLQPRLGVALRPRATRDSVAQVATMKGWRAFRLNTAEAYREALRHFASAIARDSSYGYAWAGLATVRHWQGALRFTAADSAYQDARRHADRALALDSALVDGWLILGRLAENVERDLPRAESLYARAVRVAPSDARPYGRRAVLLSRLGRRDEALASALRSVALDPASPAVYADLAGLYVEFDRYADAERATRQALSLDPGHPILLGNLATQLVAQEKFAAAESTIVLARRKVPDDAMAMGRHAYILARLGRADAARALADSAEARGLSLVQIAVTHTALGDTSRALDALERAVRSGDDGITALLDTSMFVPLRGSARYRKLVEVARAGSGT